MSKPHGLMFHHFFNDQHIKGQGAISSEQFERIILEYKDRIINAEEWMQRSSNGTLREDMVCITFDDALLCQYDIAYPILKKYNITAFWFIYSSIFEGKIEELEFFRKFRMKEFQDIDGFYETFFQIASKSEFQEIIQEKMPNYDHRNWSKFPFYTENDTKFRYIRDSILGPENYKKLMYELIASFKIDPKEYCRDLWLRKEQVLELTEADHIIGLHSHTHPTSIGSMSPTEQRKEYEANYSILCELTKSKITCSSHPCNSYNDHTLNILDELGVVMAFRANMEDHLFSKFEYPREDHANIIKRLAL